MGWWKGGVTREKYKEETRGGGKKVETTKERKQVKISINSRTRNTHRRTNRRYGKPGWKNNEYMRRFTYS